MHCLRLPDCSWHQRPYRQPTPRLLAKLTRTPVLIETWGTNSCRADTDLGDVYVELGADLVERPRARALEGEGSEAGQDLPSCHVYLLHSRVEVLG